MMKRWLPRRNRRYIVEQYLEKTCPESTESERCRFADAFCHKNPRDRKEQNLCAMILLEYLDWRKAYHLDERKQKQQYLEEEKEHNQQQEKQQKEQEEKKEHKEHKEHSQEEEEEGKKKQEEDATTSISIASSTASARSTRIKMANDKNKNSNENGEYIDASYWYDASVIAMEVAQKEDKDAKKGLIRRLRNRKKKKRKKHNKSLLISPPPKEKNDDDDDEDNDNDDDDDDDDDFYNDTDEKNPFATFPDGRPRPMIPQLCFAPLASTETKEAAMAAAASAALSIIPIPQAIQLGVTPSSSSSSSSSPSIACSSSYQYKKGDVLLRANDGRQIFLAIPAIVEKGLVSHDIYGLALALYLDNYFSRHDVETCYVCIDVRAGIGWPNRPVSDLIGLIRAVVRILNNYHPERVHQALIYPVPKVALTLWNIIKPILPEVISAKTVLIQGDDSWDARLQPERFYRYGMSEPCVHDLEMARQHAFVLEDNRLYEYETDDITSILVNTQTAVVDHEDTKQPETQSEAPTISPTTTTTTIPEGQEDDINNNNDTAVTNYQNN